MRCFNCHKNFDYEKYYGICPKCGSFNKKEGQQEYESGNGDISGYSEPEFREETSEYEEPHLNESNTEYRAAEPAANPYVFAQERKGKAKGTGIFVAGILVFFLGIASVIGSIIMGALRAEPTPEPELSVRNEEHMPGESFSFQQSMSLQVLECVELANKETLPLLREGWTLVAVHIAGESDGMYEDYNSVHAPYLEADGEFYEALPSYNFEPYGQMLGAYPVLNEYSLQNDSSCDGWYAFVVEEDVQEARIWFYAYDWTEWDGGNSLGRHYVEMPILRKGGEVDAE